MKTGHWCAAAAALGLLLQSTTAAALPSQVQFRLTAQVATVCNVAALSVVDLGSSVELHVLTACNSTQFQINLLGGEDLEVGTSAAGNSAAGLVYTANNSLIVMPSAPGFQHVKVILENERSDLEGLQVSVSA